MTNYEIIEVKNSAGELIKHAIIDRGNGEYTSMLKSIYDAEYSTENPTEA